MSGYQSMLQFRVVATSDLIGIVAAATCAVALGTQEANKPLPLKYVGPLNPAPAMVCKQ
jgi:hypothetical protein